MKGTYMCVGPATMAELNASNLAVDSAFSVANRLTSQMAAVNASITAVADSIADLQAAHDSNSLQRNQLNDNCEYCCHIQRMI